MSISTITLPDNPPPIKAQSNSLDFYYGSFKALKGVSMPVYENKVTALIGPSGCGKSTLLRCLNRMNDLVAGARIEGKVYLDDADIYAAGVDVEIKL